MRLAVIVNPAAGGGRAGRALGDVTAALHRLGLEHHVQTTRSLDHARELAREAAASGEVAVAFGGDGLIGAVAGALRGTEGVLGLLPGGRGNDLARALGIPTDSAAACDVLARGRTAPLDLGAAGDATFVGIASCGLDSDANRIANETTWLRGNFVYTYAALRALVQWKPASFTVSIDGGRPRTIRGYTIAAAGSSSYGGGMRLAPEAQLDDGLLDVVVISQMSKPRLLRLLPTVFWGGHTRYPEVEILRARSVQIAASRPFTLYADGDPIAQLPVTVTVLPAAVRTIVP